MWDLQSETVLTFGGRHMRWKTKRMQHYWIKSKLGTIKFHKLNGAILVIETYDQTYIFLLNIRTKKMDLQTNIVVRKKIPHLDKMYKPLRLIQIILRILFNIHVLMLMWKVLQQMPKFSSFEWGHPSKKLPRVKMLILF